MEWCQCWIEVGISFQLPIINFHHKNQHSSQKTHFTSPSHFSEEDKKRFLCWSATVSHRSNRKKKSKKIRTTWRIIRRLGFQHVREFSRRNCAYQRGCDCSAGIIARRLKPRFELDHFTAVSSHMNVNNGWWGFLADYTIIVQEKYLTHEPIPLQTCSYNFYLSSRQVSIRTRKAKLTNSDLLLIFKTNYK